MFEVIRPIEKLVILGMGRSANDWIAHNYSMPVHGEVWTINHGGLIFRHDVLWDMHCPAFIEDLSKTNPTRADRIRTRRPILATHDKPIVMAKADPSCPTSVTFPLKEVVELTKSTYFNDGFSYMLAAAMCCEVKQLSLFGVDFIGPEFTEDRACAMYWLGRLIQAGCKMGNSSATPLVDRLRPQSGQIYGYHEPLTFDYGSGKQVFAGPVYE